MKYLFSLTISLLFLSSALLVAQNAQDQYPHKKLDRLQSFLNLTDIQIDQIKTELAELKSDETLGHHLAMKQALKSVLTPKQMDRLHSKEAWKRHRRPHRHMWHKADDDVKQKLREMRSTLDDYISEEDRVAINELRSAKAQKKANWKIRKNTFKEMSREEKARMKKRAENFMRGHFPEHNKAKVLAEKYKSEIIDIFKENEAFFMEMKAADRTIAKADDGVPACEDCDCHPVPRESVELGKAYAVHKRIAFLLMDTRQADKEVEIKEAKSNAINLYPNPTSDRTQISFTIETASDVMVDIRDDQGRLVQTLINQHYEVGEYTEEINTTTFESGVYLVSFSDGIKLQTEKLVIQK